MKLVSRRKEFYFKVLVSCFRIHSWIYKDRTEKSNRPNKKTREEVEEGKEVSELRCEVEKNVNKRRQ